MIFGVQHVAAAALIFVSAGAGAILRRGLAKYSGPLRNNLFREHLGVIGTCHARIKMDFPIAGEHTSTG